MVSANRIDSRSRISPTSRTSGSSRRAERSASGNEGVSEPTSRWFTAERLWSCTYSIGSSMVRMWQARVLLMLSSIAASEVDLHERVAADAGLLAPAEGEVVVLAAGEGGRLGRAEHLGHHRLGVVGRERAG